MYVIVWQFQVTPGRERAFEEAYGPDGDWARFFGRSAGFQGTELLRAALEPSGEAEDADASEAAADAEVSEDASQDGRDYLTIDRWASADAYAAFNEQFAAAYEEMDKRFLDLCVVEVCLGHFEAVD
jgi:heme-degrading monooxygenase HmoA